MDAKSIAPIVVRLRNAAGLTQEKLAEKAGVHRNTIVAIEAGTLDGVRLQTLEAVAVALGVDVISLIQNATLPAGTSKTQHVA